MTDLSPPYLLSAGETRLGHAMLPFKLLASDSGGRLSICEFTLPGWSSGPPLHRHNEVDEGFYVVSGTLEFQLGERRVVSYAGDFAWVPRGTAHTFASASAAPVHVVGFASPGGIEHLFAEQHSYFSGLTGPPDDAVLHDMGMRHGAPTVGPPITPSNAPAIDS